MASAALTDVETPSGKDAAYENFPVGSWLLPAALRPHIATFYAYARAIDDIADAADLSAAEKLTRLDGFAEVLLGGRGEAGFAKAHAMRHSLQETGVTPQHCLDLIAAFRQDAVKRRYASWDELIDYCNRSAAPVGRYLLDLHGGCRGGYAASDALCNALQVINHLQDCQEDYLTLDRVYLPETWLAAEGAVTGDLAQPAATPAIRRVLDRCLGATDRLLLAAAALPRGLHSRRLAMESAAILEIAKTLSRRLRRDDPLAGRVALGKADYVWCCIRGASRVVI
jgi:squalene synthase HpnC